MKLTHLDNNGSAIMVDVGEKEVTTREAVAQAVISMKPQTLDMIVNGEAKKGDVLATARIAGIMAAKRTSDLIPLCHPLALTSVQVELNPLPPERLLITAIVRCKQVTGVEMEALMAASIAALTIYDMCKAVDRGMRMDQVYLLKKSGGLSGLYERENEDHSCIECVKLDADTCEKCVESPIKNGKKTAIIKEIYLKPQKGSKKLSLYECNLDENGVEGYTKGDKAISLIDKNACNSMEKVKDQGLCTKRFYGNFVTDGIDYLKLKPGDQFMVGEACIEITQVGKACFEGCDLVDQKKKCPIKVSCAFAKVVHPGTVQLGSKLK